MNAVRKGGRWGKGGVLLIKNFAPRVGLSDVQQVTSFSLIRVEGDAGIIA